jgi:hypothetical protein
MWTSVSARAKRSQADVTQPGGPGDGAEPPCRAAREGMLPGAPDRWSAMSDAALIGHA